MLPSHQPSVSLTLFTLVTLIQVSSPSLFSELQSTICLDVQPPASLSTQMAPQYHTSPSPKPSPFRGFLTQGKELSPILQHPSVGPASAHSRSSPHPADTELTSHTLPLWVTLSPAVNTPLLAAILSYPGYCTFQHHLFKKAQSECLIPLLKSLFMCVPYSWDSPNTSPCCMRPRGSDLGPPLQHHLSPEPSSWPAPHSSAPLPASTLFLPSVDSSDLSAFTLSLLSLLFQPPSTCPSALNFLPSRPFLSR